MIVSNIFRCSLRLDALYSYQWFGEGEGGGIIFVQYMDRCPLNIVRILGFITAILIQKTTSSCPEQTSHFYSYSLNDDHTPGLFACGLSSPIDGKPCFSRSHSPTKLITKTISSFQINLNFVNPEAMLSISRECYDSYLIAK